MPVQSQFHTMLDLLSWTKINSPDLNLSRWENVQEVHCEMFLFRWKGSSCVVAAILTACSSIQWLWPHPKNRNKQMKIDVNAKILIMTMKNYLNCGSRIAGCQYSWKNDPVCGSLPSAGCIVTWCMKLFISTPVKHLHGCVFVVIRRNLCQSLQHFNHPALPDHRNNLLLHYQTTAITYCTTQSRHPRSLWNMMTLECALQSVQKVP
jgi:hypothetical protein